VEPPAIRTVIVDDHAVFAEALSQALSRQPDVTPVGVAGTIADGLALVRDLLPDVVLMDVHLPDGDGTAAVAQIHAEAPEIAVIVLTGAPSLEHLSRAVEAGASGFLAKSEQLRDVAAAIRRVHGGAVLFDATTLRSVAAHLRERDHGPGADLTTREREVLQLLAAGAATETIAESLVLSLHTVRNHVRNILAKLRAHTKLEAVIIALRHGLIDLDGLAER